MGKGVNTYIDLIVCPSVHSQGLYLGNVRSQFAMDRGASHAKEDAQLKQNHVSTVRELHDFKSLKR